MAHSSNKKIFELVPKANRKSIDATDSLEKFKNKIEKRFIKFEENQKKLTDQFNDDKKKTLKELNNLKKEVDALKNEIQRSLEQLSVFAGTSPSEIREELINGIRMLGERVSSAITRINDRLDVFSQQVTAKMEKIADENAERQQKERDEPFGSIKEGELFDVDDFEVVPREALEKLTLLFKKQTMAVKNFINRQALGMQKLETKLKIYDEENTHLFELLNRRIVRNFRISLLILIFVLILIVVLRII